MRLATMLGPAAAVAAVVAMTPATATATATVDSTIASSASPKTNFLILFVDDMGFGDLGSYGAPTTSTPHIDALAASGVRFTQWYSAHPICTPSRAAMVTGRLPIRNGLCGGEGGAQGVFACDAKFGLPLNETTFAAALQPAGYRSMAIGKWHLGVGNDFEYMPHRHGFTSYYGVPYSVDMGHAYNNRTPEASFEENYYGCTPLPLVANETVLEQPTDLGRLNERYVDQATQFLQGAAADGVPFLLYVAFGHVHTPQFAGVQHEGVSRRGIFGDSVAELDAAVGAIMAALHALPGDIADDTLVIFTSDNGAPNAAQHAAPWLPLQPIFGSNGPFLGEKTTTWEGGLRVPGIVAWPRVVRRAGAAGGRGGGTGGGTGGAGGGVTAGTVSEELVSTLDVFATVLAAAGVPLPTDRVMDSHSLLPLLDGSVAAAAAGTGRAGAGVGGAEDDIGGANWTRDTAFFYRGCELFAVRHKQWKYHLATTPPATQPPAWDYANVTAAGTRPLLFQIENDPSERFPLLDHAATADVVKEIEAVIAAHRAQLGTPPAPILAVKGGAQVCCDQARNCSCTPPPPPSTRQEL